MKDFILEIFRPMKTNALSQRWGQSLACAKMKGNYQPYRPFIIKAISRVTGLCDAGWKLLYPLLGLKYHNGWDFSAWMREGIYHNYNFEGWFKSEIDPDGGIGVDVVSNEPLLQCTEPGCNEIHYIKGRHWHNSKLVGHDRQVVKPGQLIALAGTTGASSGVHDHTSTKWCDKYGNSIHSNNGTYGAFDDTKYRNNEIFILDHLKSQQLTTIETEIKEQEMELVDYINKIMFIIKRIANLRAQLKKLGGILFPKA